MDVRRWEEIQAAFDALVELDPIARARRLEILDATDPAFRATVAALLAADAEAEASLAPLEAILSSVAVPDPLGLSGSTVSHFRLLEPLGAGGMGVVYRAEDAHLGRAVALKFLLPHFGLDSAAKARFLREARSAAALDHPNLCTIHEVGESQDGRLFLAMALYPGETLQDRLRRDGSLPVPIALEITRQIALGLGCAHAAGIVHRDLKPGNLMVLPDGTVKILDFGLARSRDESHSGASAGWGTAAYMAPEQLLGQAVDARTDLWALGVVLYEMVTGKKPFGEGREVAIAHAILKEEPVPASNLCADATPQLEHVILTLLEKDPARRPANATSVIDLLTAPGRTGAPLLRRRARRRLFVGLASAAAFAAGAIGIRQLARSGRGVAPPPPIRRIAVLPLENLSGDTSQQYFVEGMHDALVTELAKISALSVISHTSVLGYRHTTKTVPQIARELHVDAVVEGSVILAGDSVHITAQLIAGPADRHLWADTYVKSRRNLLQLYADVTQAIAREVRIALTPEERTRLANARAIDPKANDLYLRGKYHCESWAEDGVQRGIAFHRRAIEQDPTFALAYEGLAACYADWAFFDNAPATDVTPLAKAAATRALELDSTLGLPHATLAWIRFVNDLDFVGPDQEFRRALALSPGSSWIRSIYGSYLTFAGRFDDAIRLKRQAVELDPLSVATSFSLGFDLHYARRYDESIAELRRTLVLDPSNFSARLVMAADYALKGMQETALAQCDSGVDMAPQRPDAAESCAWINARLGRRQQALDLLQRMTSTTRRYRTDPIEIAKVYLNLGDRDRAIAWLRRAARERFPPLVFLKTDPILDPLRSDPRFQALLRDLGI